MDILLLLLLLLLFLLDVVVVGRCYCWTLLLLDVVVVGRCCCWTLMLLDVVVDGGCCCWTLLDAVVAVVTHSLTPTCMEMDESRGGASSAKMSNRFISSFVLSNSFSA